MKLIVGLGNPGLIYAFSRHNIGFSVVKNIAKSHKASLKRERGVLCKSAKLRIEGQAVLIATPLTFMNLSGIAVAGLLRKYKIDLADLLVVCDDLDLGFGRLKLRPGGSSAGHRGIQSIINSLRNNEFARLRIGIGRPLKNTDAADYVLSPFNRKESKQVREMIIRATECCSVWVTKGTTETMNIFNKRGDNE